MECITHSLIQWKASREIVRSLAGSVLQNGTDDLKALASARLNTTQSMGIGMGAMRFLLETEVSEGAKQAVGRLDSLALLRATAGSVLLVVGLIVFLYGRKGPMLVLKVLGYIGALATMKGAVKLVEDRCAFEFPLFISGTHFFSGLLVAFVILKYQSIQRGADMMVPSLKVFSTQFVPVAFAFAASIVMGNISLVYSSTAFVEIVSASSPIITVFIAIAMNQPFNLYLLGPCCLVFIGCALTSNGEPHFSWMGLVMATGANVPRALKAVLQQMLLKNDANAIGYSPMEVLCWTCLPSWVAMLCWSLAQEGVAPYQTWYSQGVLSELTFFLLLSCVNACILNTAILFVIKDIGAVGTQIVAQTKSILVVLGGACFLKEEVSQLEVIGFMLTMAGVYTYNDLDSRLKAQRLEEQAAQQEQAVAAPVPNDSKLPDNPQNGGH